MLCFSVAVVSCHPWSASCVWQGMNKPKEKLMKKNTHWLIRLIVGPPRSSFGKETEKNNRDATLLVISLSLIAKIVWCLKCKTWQPSGQWKSKVKSVFFTHLFLRTALKFVCGFVLLSDRAPRLVFLACIDTTTSQLASNVPRPRVCACTRPLSRLWTIAVAAKEAAKLTQPTLPLLLVIAAVSWLSGYVWCEKDLNLNSPKQTGAWRLVKASSGIMKFSLR